MKADELRERFISFFIRQGHRHIPSASLVPEGDPTLLFTGAGMNQFKAQFLGREITFSRAVTCQKCLRTDDLIYVGKTPGHHTFFEMLGNFSFGDYFKKEAISFAWEFVVKELSLNPHRLWVSVYKEDEEAYEVWEKIIRVPKERLVRLSDRENFWPSEAVAKGPNGPCGPCSEIFYDQGERYGCGQADCRVSCSCGRFVEIWNLVFTQFDRQPSGKLIPLPQKNIDTGLGLERTAAVLQGVPNNFETDLLFPILKNVAEVAKVRYGEDKKKDIALRIITDHLRAITFTISDGVFPSNEGRGYVLRRLIRLSLRQGMNLGLGKPFLYRLVHIAGKSMSKGYPELEGRYDQIALIIKAEEERFINTLSQGGDVLEGVLAQAQENKFISADMAFRLYDTYGLPLEVVKSMAAERGLSVDEKGFEERMEKQKVLAREGSSLEAEIFSGAGGKEVYVHFPATGFAGYEILSKRSLVLGLIKDGKSVESLGQEERGEIILEITPFYAEAGGQVGDKGWLKTSTFSFKVEDTVKIGGVYVHRGCVIKGRITIKEGIEAEVNGELRNKISRHHTAAHLLHYALREVLGLHVTQAGSYVGPDKLRFDFHHYKALTPQEIEKVEGLINQRIREGSSVQIQEMPLAEAKKTGAMALFGERYGEKVRVVKIGRFSQELCAGAHISSLGFLGLFIIFSEKALSAGTRRIEGLAGEEAWEKVKRDREILARAAALLKIRAEELIGRLEELMAQNKKLQQENEKRKEAEIEPDLEELIGQAKEIGGWKLITASFKDISIDHLRQLADRLKRKVPGVGGLISTNQGKVNLVVFVSANLTTKFKANEVIAELGAILGGGGGGRPDMAQAGGTDSSRITDVFKRLEEKVKEVIGHG